MRFDQKDICKAEAKENGLDLALVESINHCMFAGFNDWLKNPKSLRLRIPSFGVFYFRKKRTKEKLLSCARMLPTARNVKQANILTTLAEHCKFILSEYDKWDLEKQRIKKLRSNEPDQMAVEP